MNLSQRLAILTPAGLARLDNPSWKYAPHLRLLTNCLIKVVRGEISRLVVSMPPQHGKSLLVSKYFPAWFLGNFPNKKIILASYEAGYAGFWGGHARDTLLSYGNIFEGKIKGGNSAAAGFWELEQGGYMATAGMGGPITGRGADCFIIDDPVKNAEESLSKTIQEKHWDWYHSTALTRLQPAGAMIILMTRWNENDLAGRILATERKDWTVINLPAICDSEDDALGRKIGEALFPQRYNADYLLNIKRTMPAYWWQAMYQGKPSPREGGLFRRDWWQYYTVLPKILRTIWSWDTAVKTGQANDYSVGQLWAEGLDGYYLIRQIRGRMEYPELKKAIESAYIANKTAAVLIEDKSSGQQLIQELKRGSKCPIVPVEVNKDKVLRANFVTPICESKKVFIPENEAWVSELVEEFAAFPAGAHDDQIDAATQALSYLSGSRARPNLNNVLFGTKMSSLTDL